jgi:hypothetical protein
MLSRVFGSGSIYESLHRGNRYNPNRYSDHGIYDSRGSHEESYPLNDRGGRHNRYPRDPATSAYRHFENTLPDLNEEEINEDVPESLLVEGGHHGQENAQDIYESFNPDGQQALDDLERGLPPPQRGTARIPETTVFLGLIDPKERAMWKWVNVENLDVFLQEVYPSASNH